MRRCRSSAAVSWYSRCRRFCHSAEYELTSCWYVCCSAAARDEGIETESLSFSAEAEDIEDRRVVDTGRSDHPLSSEIATNITRDHIFAASRPRDIVIDQRARQIRPGSGSDEGAKAQEPLLPVVVVSSDFDLIWFQLTPFLSLFFQG